MEPIMNESTPLLWSHARRAPLALLLTASAALAAPNVPPPAQEEPILITGATLHTVSGASIVGGRMLFSDGRIVAIGGADLNVQVPARVVDLSGLHVYPGLIDANTALGLVEIEAVRATLDIAEPGPVNANVRAERAVNPDSELLPVARANGVLIALSVPNPGENGLIVGTSAAIQLDGWTWEDMTVRAPVGMHVFWPAMRVPDDVPEVRRTELIERRDERIETLETSLEQAAAYRRARAADASTPVDLRWEALLPVLAGELPLFAHAEDLMQIRHALNIAERFGLKMVLVGGADAWRIADELAAKQVPVIVATVNRAPQRRWEAYSTAFENAAKLVAAGVEVAIAGNGTAFDAAHVRNLPYEAAKAVAHGLSRSQALESITLAPARILGIDARLGSLDVGKDATFIVTTGDPLETATDVRQAFVRGRAVDLATRHTTLHEKYSERLRQLGHASR
jgi:imidazolonepropionase-like amidohydrolase